MTKDEIFTEIAQIAASYELYQCVECADAIKQWLKQNNVNGVHLQVSTVGRIKILVSNRWKNGEESISQTGIHQGIETSGKVFDNLSTEGLDRDSWLADFECASGILDVTEIEWF